MPHLVPSHVAQVIRATMPKLGLVEQRSVVPLTPAPTTVPQLATRFARNGCSWVMMPLTGSPNATAPADIGVRARVRLPETAHPHNDPQYGSNGV
jgi:hypothetical protein